jgi:transposase
MRKGFQGLTELARKNHDIFEGDLFVFVGKRRDRCKVLFWDRGGFVLVYKRLERGRFKLPQYQEVEFEMTSSELAMLLDGLDFSRVKRSNAWRPLKKSESKMPRGIDMAI